MTGLTDIYSSQQEIAAMLEDVKSGKREESDLLQGYKQLAEMAQSLKSNVENATWITSYYDDKVAVLTDCVTALALFQQTVHEAGAENDDAKRCLSGKSFYPMLCCLGLRISLPHK